MASLNPKAFILPRVSAKYDMMSAALEWLLVFGDCIAQRRIGRQADVNGAFTVVPRLHS